MKKPLVALLIAPDEQKRRDILTGKQFASIRMGYRDYEIGQTVMLCCHLVPWVVQADITEVWCYHVRDLTEADCLAAGFDCIDGMIKSLKKFYPDINSQSLITVIRWNNVRGKLVDELADDPCPFCEGKGSIGAAGVCTIRPKAGAICTICNGTGRKSGIKYGD